MTINRYRDWHRVTWYSRHGDLGTYQRLSDGLIVLIRPRPGTFTAFTPEEYGGISGPQFDALRGALDEERTGRREWVVKDLPGEARLASTLDAVDRQFPVPDALRAEVLRRELEARLPRETPDDDIPY